jgi:hypothetical protein
MRKLIVLGTTLAALTVPAASASAEPNEQAACVGAFSSFFAHDGLGMHRSDFAQDFAHNSRPAGRSVYSQAAQFHGSVDECFEQT